MEENRNEKNSDFEKTETEVIEQQEPVELTESAKESSEKGNKTRKGLTSTQGGLTLRTVIGAFLLYYAYTIIRDISLTAEGSRAMLYVFAIVFGVAGIWVIIDSLKRLIKKEYDQ